MNSHKGEGLGNLIEPTNEGSLGLIAQALANDAQRLYDSLEAIDQVLSYSDSTGDLSTADVEQIRNIVRQALEE